MSLDNHTAQPQLTSEERRELLRAFADRMLLKVTTMDTPEDLPGVERAVRVAAVIERLYSRCDRAERQIREQKSHARKVEAEHAINETAAIKAQVSLANTLKWGEDRRRDLGHWWDAAQSVTQKLPQNLAPNLAPNLAKTVTEAPIPSQKPAIPEGQLTEVAFKAALAAQHVTYVDMTDDIEAARAELALKKRSAAPSAHIPIPPLKSG